MQVGGRRRLGHDLGARALATPHQAQRGETAQRLAHRVAANAVGVAQRLFGGQSGAHRMFAGGDARLYGVGHLLVARGAVRL